MSGTAELAARIGRQAGAPSDHGTWSSDPYTHALTTGQGPLFLRRADGWLLLLEVERWCAEPDTADLEVLRRCEGSVLDVGCGPGRLVAALSRQYEVRYGSTAPYGGAAPGRVAAPPRGATSHDGAADDRRPLAPLGARGCPVLGIDVSEAAITRTIARGGSALRRSVFEPLPAEGSWGTALLIDGNIGIGGDPQALLARMSQLLAPGGLLIAETAPDPDLDERVQVHVTDSRGVQGSPFPWARLGTSALLRHANRWRAVDQWTAGGRCFVALRSRSRNRTAEPPKRTAVSSSQRDRKRSADRPVADA